MWIADQWKDYEVLDTSKGEKLERWGEYRLIRPDPQVIWDTPRDRIWRRPNAHYHRSKKGGGECHQADGSPSSCVSRIPSCPWSTSVPPGGFPTSPRCSPSLGAAPSPSRAGAQTAGIKHAPPSNRDWTGVKRAAPTEETRAREG